MLNTGALATNLEETTAILDISNQPGGEQCQAKVTATDGFNSVYALSDPFALPDQSPLALILTQEETVAEGDIVFLSASVYDPEEGALGGEQVRWRSSLDGALGTGAYVETTLSSGEHTIILEVFDQAGNVLVNTMVLTVTKTAVFTPLDANAAIPATDTLVSTLLSIVNAKRIALCGAGVAFPLLFLLVGGIWRRRRRRKNEACRFHSAASIDSLSTG